MERKPCPYCGEEIAVNAKKCRYCGEWLEDTNKPANPDIKSNTNPVQQLSEDEKTRSHNSIRGNMKTQSKCVLEDVPKGFFETYFLDSFIRKYTSFSGLASRKEFWLTYVAMTVISLGICGLSLMIMGLGGTGGMLTGYILISLMCLAFILPLLALCCRRLRDAGFNPWMILVSLIPVLGNLALIVMYCRPSKNRHNPKWTRFDNWDGIIIGACVILLGIGVWSMTRPNSNTDFDDLKRLYEVPDTLEYAVESVVAIDDDYAYDTLSYEDSYRETNNYASNRYGVDESLFDLLISPESVLRGETGLVPLRIGKDYERIFYDTGSTHIQVIGKGKISHNDISVKCFLTEDGELHGRYRNHTQGVDLDINGYIQPNGDLYIQLGHDSEKSEWRLHPVSDESPKTYRYEGTWGRKNLDSYIVFWQDTDE